MTKTTDAPKLANETRRSESTSSPTDSESSLRIAAGFFKLLLRRWTDFWFMPTSGSTVATYRTALGLLNLYWILTLLQDLDWFFGDRAVDTVANYKGARWGLFQWLDAETWAGPLCLVAIFASIGLIAGKFVRISGVILAVATLSLFRSNGIIWNAGDGLLRIINVLFGSSCLLLNKAQLNTALFGSNGEGQRRIWPTVTSFPLRLVQVQLTVIYLNAIIEKIPGQPWREGTAAAMALKLETMQRFWAPEFLTENLLVANLLTWSTLGLEFALPFLLWTKRTRNFAIVAGILMHAAFDYGLFIGIFSYAMFVCYTSFFPSDRTEQALTWLADRAGKRRAGNRFRRTATAQS